MILRLSSTNERAKSFIFSASFSEIELILNDYDSTTKEFTGSYDVINPEEIHVVELNSGNGLVCTTNEVLEFKHDERSSTYGK